MANHHEKPPQVAGKYIHLPQSHGEEPELTPKQREYLELSKSLAVEADTPFAPPAHNNGLLDGDFDDWAESAAKVQEDFKGASQRMAEAAVQTGNPKDAIGDTKPDLSLVPPAAVIYLALAMTDGANKYGPYNWRENKVRARVYVAAALRHINTYLDGENLAPDSRKPHLAHAIACLGILADATETGNLIDDRPIPGVASDLIDVWTDKA